MSKKKPIKRGSRGSVKFSPTDHPEDCLCAICYDKRAEGGEWSSEFLTTFWGLVLIALLGAGVLMQYEQVIAKREHDRIRTARLEMMDRFLLKEFSAPVDPRNEPVQAPTPVPQTCGAFYSRRDGARCRDCRDTGGKFSECGQ